MKQAVGILFLSPGDRALFLKRAPNKNHPNEWCLPGGRLKKDELPEDAAIRESTEELGADVTDGKIESVPVEHTRSQQDDIDFITFRQRVSEEFAPNLEALYRAHTGYAWAPVGSPPEPLHPGCAIALERLSMDELGVARAIADGRLTSPQKLDNLALYAMRVSGTGVSYRRGLDEFVWRDPAIYLSQDMIDRCAGLPVVMEHPASNTLTSEEFADRVVGVVMFGYVEDDELWCIARIYDENAIEMMEKHQLSTSPAVVFKDPSVNSKTTLEDGSNLLIEGKPSLLDHLAICQQGVWDKSGKPTGIDVVRKDSAMSKETLEADAVKAAADAEKEVEMKKADADAGEKIDKILECLDSMNRRMDAYDVKAAADAEKAAADAEKAKADWDEEEDKKKEERDSKSKKDEWDGEEEGREKSDPKKLAADKSKKDAEGGSEEKNPAEKNKSSDHKNEGKIGADSARKDSDADMRKKIADLEAAITDTRARMPKQLSHADYNAMGNVQAKADRVFTAFGDSAPGPMDGETLLSYRRRLARELQKHSDDWRDIDLGVIGVDSKAFELAESKIYADAMSVAAHPVDIGMGILREVRRRNPDTGHMVKEYYGSPRAWMEQFSGGRRLAKFNLGGDRR
jgi:8-oxo-dGTP pyrophosphatase MutT (NUDIX family)